MDITTETRDFRINPGLTRRFMCSLCLVEPAMAFNDLFHCDGASRVADVLAQLSHVDQRIDHRLYPRNGTNTRPQNAQRR
jgi:hypothetical protein